MQFKQWIKNNVPAKFFSIEILSIKKLTLLGFTLVALPLVLALLYSAAQVNLLSKQSADAIFDVARLTQSNREINESLGKMERFASQYVVLKEDELKQQYQSQQQQLLTIVELQSRINQDILLLEAIQALSAAITEINQLVMTNKSTDISASENPNISNTQSTPFKVGEIIEASTEQTDTATTQVSLEHLQVKFRRLAAINQKINQRSNELINLHASYIKTSADQVSNIILKGLIIIPITIIVAGFFIFLITKPLKQLTRKIQILEQGNFEQKIVLKGSPEIREIADALEVMRTRLQALELQKSSFIRHISHELKTPLAAIREGTELLYDNSVGQLNADQQEVCHIIKNSVKRLQRLIEDLLDFNIVLDSTSLQDSEKVELSLLVNNILDERKLDIKRKQLKIKQSLDAIFLHSNVKQLSVILDNLLSNAIKYSPINGTITFHSVLKGNQLILKISDQGPGIKAGLQGKIFDAFYQGPAPENNQIKGSGLGLTIVKELLMRLNGSINISSDTQSPSGTSVSMRLPRAYSVGAGK